MSDAPRLGPVRVRVRKIVPANDQTAALEPRIAIKPVMPNPKKRKPNSGSFHAGDGRPRPGRPKGATGKKKRAEVQAARQAVESARSIAVGVLSILTPIMTAEGPKQVSFLYGLLRKEAELASKGDWRARKTMFDFARWAMIERSTEAGAEEALDFDGTDEAILDWFAEELRRRGEDKRASSKGARP